MATVLRQGLPRTPGGPAYPPTSHVELASHGHTEVQSQPHSPRDSHPDSQAESTSAPKPTGAPSPTPADASDGVDSANQHQQAPALRRGLPRTPGGPAWPPENAHRSVSTRASTPSTDSSHSDSGTVAATTPAAPAAPAAASASQKSASTSTPSQSASGQTVLLRRGLPREVGGDPWPPVAEATLSTGEVSAASETSGESVPAESAPKAAPTKSQDTETTTTSQSTQTPNTDKPATEKPAAKDSFWQRQFGPFSAKQWAGGALVGLLGLVVIAAIVVAAARWFVDSPTGAGFIADYDGHTPLPDTTPTGFPAWLAWQHFFNFFFMALIIKSGISIRYERKAPAYWAAKWSPGKKISLTTWFHQALDLLWIINGALFIVLLFVSGQWARIIPTTWEVFPHAASAALQYATLDWPVENGWVHYNGLQQLLYFVTVFIAAPLAVATGVRMSGLWPKSEALDKIYPASWARALHFPVAMYFTVFIVVHVIMVLATGALRNLNHMWAAQGDADPNAYANNWMGFIFFVIALVITAGAAIAARPMLLAPLARVFGQVTAR